MDTLSTVDEVHDLLWRVVRRQVDFTDPGVVFLFCGEEREVLAAANITHMLAVEDYAAAVRLFAEHRVGDAIVMVRTRPGRGDLTPEDRACCRVAFEISAGAEFSLLSAHLLTPHGVRQVLLDDAL